MPAAIRPRRRPRLKVVGSESRSPRNLQVYPYERIAASGRVTNGLIVEVWTIDQWNRLGAWERPDGVAFIPGAGVYLGLRPAAGKQDFEDARDMRDQARAAHDVLRGAETF